MATSDDAYNVQPPESPPQNPLLKNQPNKPTKLLYSHFLYKSLVVAVLLLLPLFPSSQTPQFISQNIFTRSWELVHFIFVGIAVSYGLFSRRINVETDKENLRPQIDNTHTYVSRILQVSSFFDDEPENLSGYSEDNKAWSCRYFREDPGILDDENSNEDSAVADDERRSCSSRNKQQLLLPVRSLRSHKAVNNNGYSRSLSRSTSLNLNKNARSSSGSLNSVDLEEKLKGSVVLPSPIPWRSRSARMEKKEGGVVNSPRPSIEEPSCWSPPVITNSSMSPSPKNLSPPAAPHSSEIRAKNVYRSPPPAPPPPPPQPRPIVYKRPPAATTRSSTCNYVFPSQRGGSGSSVSSEEPKDLSRNSTCSKDAPVSSTSNGKLRLLDPFKSEAQSRANVEVSTLMMSKNSAGTIREKDPVVETRKVKEFKGDKKEIEQVCLKEKVGSKQTGGGFPQPWSMRSSDERVISCENSTIPAASKQRFTNSRYEAAEGKKEIGDKLVIVESYEEDSDAEAEEQQQAAGSSKAVQVTNNTTTTGSVISDEDVNEVDKKADEFIARFREQIRLQRIESIKRSSRQHNLRNSAN